MGQLAAPCNDKQTFMTSWQTLKQELDLWHQTGQSVELWWRDDDADHPGAALRRLVKLSTDYTVPLGLAISPALTQPALTDFVAEHHCTVLQHGSAHVNHAPAGQKKCELGDHRSIETIVQELEAGRVRMRERFDDDFLPVMVPPWNRIASKILTRLNAMGFIGISVYTPRHYAIEHGLHCCNTHVDIVNWRAQEAFVGTETALGLLLSHLMTKRSQRADPNEPTGLLTHHQRHDEQSWQFMDELLARTCDHPAVRWLAPTKLFGSRPP